MEVEVDIETGQVEVTKLVHPYDVGQSINPDINDQQLYRQSIEAIKPFTSELGVLGEYAKGKSIINI